MRITTHLKTMCNRFMDAVHKLQLGKIKKFIPKNRKVRIIMIAIPLIFILIQGGRAFIAYRASLPEIITHEVPVERGDIVISFAADGQAKLDTVNLDFEVSGKLKELLVKEGDSIEPGQPLAALEESTYARLFQTAQINYEKAQANLSSSTQSNKLSLISEKQKLLELKNSFEALKAEYEAMVQIPKAYAAQELENKRRELENTEASYQGQKERYALLSRSDTDVATARANLESAAIDLATAKDNLAKTVLLAPGKAQVLNIAYAPGETIGESSNSDNQTADTSHFMVITGSDKVQIIAPVSETDLANLSTGLSAQVTFEALPGRSFPGKIVAIKALPLIDGNNLVTYDIKVELQEGQEVIRSGMTCEIQFILREKRDVLIIPNRSVSFIDNQQIVEVRTKEGHQEKRVIETGLTDGKQVEVTKGLSLGETVIYTESQARSGS